MGGIAAIFYVLGAISSIATVLLFAFPTSTTTTLLLGSVSGLIGLLGFIGFIMFLVAMYGFSKDYAERRIWDYIVTGIILTIIIAVIAFVLGVGIIFLFLFGTASFNSAAIPSSVAWILPLFSLIGLIYVVFVVRALNLLGAKSEVPLFRTGTKMLLAGSLVNIAVTVVIAVIVPYVSLTTGSLTVVSVPGALVQDAGWVLLAMAFFRIKALPPMEAFGIPNLPPPMGVTKVCPNCGTVNPADSTYCTHCGQKL